MKLEQQLINRVLVDNDHQAFTHLINQHQVQIRSYAVRLCGGNLALADDIAQETFITAYRKMSSYQHKGAFVGWLLKICYHHFLNYVRKNKHYALQDVPEVIYSDGVEHEITIEKAMLSLSLAERSVLTLHFTFGHTQQEIVDIMEMPLGTVKSHILRGKAKLTDIINSSENRGAA